jgi:hypothetical protein
MVFLLLEQQFELFHKKSAHDLIFAFLEIVQAIKRHLSCHFTDDVGVDAAHVDLNAGNFLNVFTNKVKAFSDESVDLKKFSGD